ncbi:TPA: glycosyltransferase family 2 protein [Photobacterium damselae]
MSKLIGIIVSFNRREKLENSIKNCIDNDIDHILIIDNHSNDEVISYLKSLPKEKISVHFNDENKGASAAFKQAVSYLKEICDLDNDVIVFLDDDAFISKSFKSQVLKIDMGFIAPCVTDLSGKILKMNRPWVKLPITFWDCFSYLLKRPVPSNKFNHEPIKAASFVGLTMKARTAYENRNYILDDFFIYYDDIYFTTSLTEIGIIGSYCHNINVFHDTTDEKRINNLLKIKCIFENGVVTYRKLSKWWWVIIFPKAFLYSFKILFDDMKNKRKRMYHIFRSIYLALKKVK